MCSSQIQEMFNITEKKLEETEQTLEDTTNKLVDTKKTLVKTRVDRDEQKFLVSQHIKSETKLHSQATQVQLSFLPSFRHSFIRSFTTGSILRQRGCSLHSYLKTL